MSIRLKILFACLLMTAVTVTLGVFALAAGRQLGQLAVQVYDEAFMSVSLVRSAETRFTALQSLYTAAEAAIVPRTCSYLPTDPNDRPPNARLVWAMRTSCTPAPGAATEAEADAAAGPDATTDPTMSVSTISRPDQCRRCDA